MRAFYRCRVCGGRWGLFPSLCQTACVTPPSAPPLPRRCPGCFRPAFCERTITLIWVVYLAARRWGVRSPPCSHRLHALASAPLVCVRACARACECVCVRAQKSSRKNAKGVSNYYLVQWEEPYSAAQFNTWEPQTSFHNAMLLEFHTRTQTRPASDPDGLITPIDKAPPITADDGPGKHVPLTVSVPWTGTSPRAVQFHHDGGQLDIVWLSARTAPWGVRVVPDRLTKSRKIPTRNILPLFLVSRQARVRGDQRGRPFEAAGVPHQQRGLRHRPPRRHEAVLPEPVVSVLPRSCPRSRWPTGRPTSKGEPAPFTAVWARFTI